VVPWKESNEIMAEMEGIRERTVRPESAWRTRSRGGVLSERVPFAWGWSGGCVCARGGKLGWGAIAGGAGGCWDC
jgi:hypothetical protein